MTVKDLLKHAKRYGTEGVAETGKEAGLSLANMVRLIDGLDQIEDEAARKRKFDRPKKRRISSEDRAMRLLGIEDS